MESTTQAGFKKRRWREFPGGPVDKNPSANAGDTGSIPGLGRSHRLQRNQVHVPQLLSPHTATRESRMQQERLRTAINNGSKIFFIKENE